jgi:hypothetical protein
MMGLLLAGATGAALMYFYDPEHGARRRNVARDRARATFRRGSERLDRFSRLVGAEREGFRQRLAHPASEQAPPPNDAALAQKVETEVFRDPDVPKGKINVNAEDGVVVLRGEANTPAQINAIVERVRAIPGVRDVENLLHLPQTAARMS